MRVIPEKSLQRSPGVAGKRTPLSSKPSFSFSSVLSRQLLIMELPLVATAKCKVPAVIRFLNAIGVKISKFIVS